MPATWLVAGIFFLVGVVGGAFFLLREKGTSDPLTRPAYEEVHIRSDGIHEAIGRIDRAIYEVLYQNGVYEDHIQFTEVAHRYAGGDTWDFTEMTIRLSDEGIRERVERSLLAELDRLGSDIQWWREADPIEDAAWNVLALDRLTHRIRIVVEKPLPTWKGPSRRKPRIAIIVDDLGYDRGMARAFASLDIPVSLSVLPLAPYTDDAAQEVRRHGRELMLHLPMEPKEYPELNPGPGALLREMEADEIRRLVLRHLNQIPDARGANNHMGSSFTEAPEKISVVLEELRKKGMFFVDSKTTAHSVAYGIACDMGVPSTCRDVFLDNEHTVGGVVIQLERLLGMARQRGTAVGIAHPFPETLQALKNEAARLGQEVDVVTATEIVERRR